MSEWHKVLSRNDVDLLTIDLVDASFQRAMHEFGESDDSFFSYFCGTSFTHYANLDMTGLGLKILEKYYASPTMIEDLYEKGLTYSKKSRQRAEEALAAQTQSELLDALRICREDFEGFIDLYSIHSWVAIEAWQKKFTEIVTKLTQQTAYKTEDVVYACCQPWKDTAIIEIQKNQEGLSAKELQEKYMFLRSWSLIWYRDLSLDWIEEISASPYKQVAQKDYATLLHASEEEKCFFELAPYISFLKDWRDDMRRKQVYFWRSFFEKIASFLEIESNDLGYLFFEEIETAFENKENMISLLQKRKKEPSVIALGEKPYITYEIGTYQKIISQIAEHAQKEIKGMIACKGVAKGRVVVIESYHDIKKVQQGDIIVANTTHPNYLAAMHRAAAFVTNEGGVVSHAAIVSRELQKPCIVGTHHATEILQTGDIVEVDANKGVVRRIE